MGKKLSLVKFINPRVMFFVSVTMGLMMLLAGCPQPPDSGPKSFTIALSLVAEGLMNPVGMAVPDDGTGRIFVIEQLGKIRVVDDSGTLLTTPFLDISDRMVSLNPGYDERGLLSLAFHPDFSNNGRFFVYYNAPLRAEDPQNFNSLARVSEFNISADDLNLADPESEVVLLNVPEPQSNHNGGQIAFGPDGYLYLGLGDGGSANDAGLGHTENLGNGQDPSNLLGTILRYDVGTPGELKVPATNPFIDNPDIPDPIYAYGFRNPWRFSFDTAGEPRLFCGDVGQNLFEEVDLVLEGGNYGWNIKEGTNCFDPENPDSPPAQCPGTGVQGELLIDPIMEYSQTGGPNDIIGTTVIGGFVYHGTNLPDLVGRYIFGDLTRSFPDSNGSIFVAEESEDGGWQFNEARIEGEQNGRLNRFLLSFGQDEKGEIYVLTSTDLGPSDDNTTGRVFKIVPTPSQTVEIIVENFRFDADNDDSTQVDNLRINVGDTVRWVWREGSHTVTSGEASTAEDAGALFDEPMNSANQSFSFTFTEAGTLPYFCRPHENFNMKGIIVVQ